MKKLFLFLLCQGSLDCFCQERCPSPTNVQIDTIRETMLITTINPGFCHSYEGYTVIRGGICMAHLDDRKRPLKLPVKVWDCDNAKKRREHE